MKITRTIISLIYFASGISFAVYVIKSLQEYGPEPVLILIIAAVIWIMSFLMLTVLHNDKK